ncbi:ATP-binding cassette domain-containing protein [Evansella sp. AB-P1]|uniref:ABC transporter ATP-binding protein/permease n=1 Tax=Evansella sp. AB-P1 TaxID=3037653 RepID=UPI00241DFC93|nr:ABC transporter ATP-binding protein/permease [Evansella sp. AB-P1]MDG5786792.1 ATP-binding cassette domain-containing protein [Evansella sp. AB-P1]
MWKFKLIDIRKSYTAGDVATEVLKGISLEFRESEFVTILGQSGSGKTTLLNIIGGLDRYDSGDLIIKNQSTKKYKDSDWDAYRNRSIGFVFQNYNLIGHQSVLQNVEIAMTLSGVSNSERKERAKEVLREVGLGDHIDKKPSQLSGGQMQRVAIARSLVNNPDIILADEPTGALDSETSFQVMEILKEIGKTRLVIMVTHNEELAKEYSTRVIRFLDGEVQSDSNPLGKTESSTHQEMGSSNKVKRSKTSMSLTTAMLLSFKNLLTKKGRTIITAFAGSIGIIGVALVLALSNGLSQQIAEMESDTLSSFPITISTDEQAVPLHNDDPSSAGDSNRINDYEEFTEEDVIYRQDRRGNVTRHRNVFTDEYIDFIGQMEEEMPDAVNVISYTRGVEMNVLAKGEDVVVNFAPSASSSSQGMAPRNGSSQWQEMPENEEFILSINDLIGEGSRLPTAENEIALVVDEYNRLNASFFEKLGIHSEDEMYSLNDFIGTSMLKVIPNNDFYTEVEDGIFEPAAPAQYNDLFHGDSGMELTITGILRIKENAVSEYFSQGLIYTQALTDFIVSDAKKSNISVEQQESDVDVIQGVPFSSEREKEQSLIRLGAITSPTGIDIYPNDFASKDEIKAYLDEYNDGKEKEDQVIYTDLAEMITGMIGAMINTVTYVLVGFAAISLIVSTIMIGIITYVSVIERTKEIGILRSVGARKKDVSRVFNAETLIVGFVAGLLGVGISYLLLIPINAIIYGLTEIQDLASLNVIAALLLIGGSMLLTLISGLIPARMAAKKDPVDALRTE